MGKSFLFQGSTARLHRMVENHGGAFLKNQEFELPWKSTQIKEWHRLTFRIHCHYDRKETGFCITYRILPAGLTWLRIIGSVVFWMWLAARGWNPAEPAMTLAMAAVGMVSVFSALWQLRNCEQEFFRKFSVATK